MSHVYSSSDPRRPPNWRHMRAASLIDGGRRPSRSADDEWVRLAYRLMSALRGCRQPLDFAAVASAFGAPYWAYDVHFSEALDRGNPMKAEIEARLLSGQDDKAIAARFGADPDVIDAYGRIYFDVRWAVESGARGYVMHQVLGPSLHAGFVESDYATLWKFAALTGGPDVLDSVIDIVPASYEHTGNASDWMTAAVGSQLSRKALIAATALRPNNFNAPDILAAYLKLCELSRARAAAGRGEEQAGLLEALGAAMQSMPIQAMTARKASEGHECAEFEVSAKLGVEYTVEERLCLRGGVTPQLPGGIPIEAYTFPPAADAGATAMEGVGS